MSEKTASSKIRTTKEFVLDRILNPHNGTDYLIRFTCPEFSSACPETGNLDFAKIIIEYVPQQYIVESKSLKLFLSTFKEHGAFQEDCTITIGKKLEELLNPKFLRVAGYWLPSACLPMDVFYQKGELPKNFSLHDLCVEPYSTRD